MLRRPIPRAGRLGLIAAAGAVALVATSAPLTATAAADCARISASVNEELRDRFGDYGDTAGRWTGADSAYSVPLPDGSIAWIYSDTFLGEVNESHGRPLDSPFVHNSIVVDDDGELTTHTGGTLDAPESLVKVAGADEGKNWYWFGDATVHGDELQVMLVEFVKTGDTMWDFAFAGNGVATFDASTLELRSVDDLATDGVNWGSAIYEDPEAGYTYVYGVEDLQSQKFAHLARVAGGDLADGAWEYLGDAGWSTDPANSKRILEGVSNEFSVSKYQGRYTLVTGDATEALSASIVMYRSKSLEGPFTGKTELYRTPETSGNVFTYNAKAHPELGNGHTLMITYNVNSFDTNDLYEEVDNYRPRYVDVDVKVRNGHCS
ncbi:DUF4185 domain-containing protein [Agromyces sp. NPDC058484]|uniref:DUF4185 domain-containing protein n=1 Tax=Agromyces sp. NPDC058484 TaxID=3346524 RepID=UPI00365995BF